MNFDEMYTLNYMDHANQFAGPTNSGNIIPQSEPQ